MDVCFVAGSNILRNYDALERVFYNTVEGLQEPRLHQVDGRALQAQDDLVPKRQSGDDLYVRYVPASSWSWRARALHKRGDL